METGLNKSQGIIKSSPPLGSSALIQLMRSHGKYTRLLEIKRGFPWHPAKKTSSCHSCITRASASGNLYVSRSELELYERSSTRFGTNRWNEILCQIRHLTENKIKKTLCKLLFDILDTPSSIKKLKSAKNYEKLMFGCLLLLTLTVRYLFTFFFSVNLNICELKSIDYNLLHVVLFLNHITFIYLQNAYFPL